MKLRNILSLFDGISCGRLALNRAGIEYENYYASEIDKYAIAITRYNFPNTIFVGDIRNLKGEDFEDIDLIMGGSPCQGFSLCGKRYGMSTKTKIEVTTLEQYLELKQQKFEFEGQSYLFWEFVRLLKEIRPKWFLLENVKMQKKWEKVITETLEVEPVEINSALVSAQNRKRLYWTNIPIKGLPEDKGILLKDILESEVDEKYYIKKPFKYLPDKLDFIIDPYNRRNITDGKATTLRTNFSNGNCWVNESLRCRQVAELAIKGQDCIKRIYSSEGKSPTLTTMQGGYRQPKIIEEKYITDRNKSLCIDANYYKGGNLKQYFEKHRRQLVFEKDRSKVKIRRLTPLECERLQTLPDNYTKYGIFENGRIKQISDTQRYKTIGNAWTVDVIAWIFSFLKLQ
ncbi:MAG: DNA (cytosine-5-)-methyltransferase [Candidatus Cloacimonadota bacterium]|nr:MAG: DNA (cytosine-5-)-methyltransferase [Candidatus Cloacimonadota bacterium]